MKRKNQLMQKKLFWVITATFLALLLPLRAQEGEQDTPIHEYDNPEPMTYSNDFKTIYVAEYVSDGANVPKETFFPLKHALTYGEEQLTPNGEAQLYNLGTALYSMYPKIFSIEGDEQHRPSKFYKVYAENTPISQASAISHLMGLYPPAERYSFPITATQFPDTKLPLFKEPKDGKKDSFAQWGLQKVATNSNSTEGEEEKGHSGPSASLPHYLFPHYIRTFPDDQDFLFHTAFDETCPKLNPKVQRAEKFMHSDIKRPILQHERYLDKKFLKKGMKEIKGFKWTIREIIRVYNGLLSFFAETGQQWMGVPGGYGKNWGHKHTNKGDQEPEPANKAGPNGNGGKRRRVLFSDNGGYSGGLTGFLGILANLKGTWELGVRDVVKEFIAIENLHLINTLYHEFEKKVVTDKVYFSALTAANTGLSNNAQILKNAKENYYEKSFLLFAGRQERLVSLMKLLGLAEAKCFKIKAKAGNYKDNVKGTECGGLPDYPGPASNIVFELLRKESVYYVRILYNGKPFKFCRSEYYCPYDTFKRMLLAKVKLDGGYYSHCRNERRSITIIDNEVKVVNKRFKYGVELGSLLLFQLCLLFGIWCCCQQRRVKSMIGKEIKKRSMTEGKWSLNDSRGNIQPDEEEKKNE